MLKFRLLAIFLLGALAMSARTVDEVVAEVLSNDPALTAERSRLKGLEDEIHASNTLAGPEVGMSYKWGLKGIGNKWDLEVGQSFDWPGLYRARSRQASMQASAYATLYRAKEVSQALVVRRAVYNLLAAREDMELLTRWEKNLEELAKVYDRQLQRGETTILEVNKLKMEIFLAHSRIAEARNGLKTAESDLCALNGGSLPENIPSGMPMESLDTYEWYTSHLVESDPEVAASRRLFDLARQEARVAAMSAAPGFKIAYLFENEAGEKFHGFSFALTLPAWNNRAKVRASEARLIEVMAQSDLVALERRAQLQSQYAAAIQAQELLRAGESLFGSQSEYLSVLRKAFDGGKFNLLDFIREENEYIQAALEYNKLRLDYNLAAASLNRDRFATDD